MFPTWYRFQITSVLSILHRLSGIALAVGSILLAWWLVAVAAAELSGARRPDDSCWTCSVVASDALRGKTTYCRSCSLGRVMPCSIAAEQRHKIIRKGVALVCEESVSGVTAELPPGQSGAPTHARLYHRQRRNHAVPRGAGGSQ